MKLKIVLLFYFIIQLVYILFFQLPFVGDSSMYYNLAQTCIQHNSFYPAAHNLNDAYIIAPLYVNYIILLLHIYDSPTIILLFNIILNLLNLLLLRKITDLLFQKKKYTDTITVLYLIYLSSLGAVLMNVTELFFCALLFAGYYLILKNTKQSLFFAGMFTALAFATRQVALALILTYFLVSIIRKQFSFFKSTLLISGFAVTLLLFGVFTWSQSGKFVMSPNTGALNMLIGANDNATGAYNNIAFEKGHAGYIENFDKIPYYKKAEFWKNQTLSWIKQNPVKWLMLFPKKIAHMFMYDDWSIHTLVPTNDWNLYLIGKTIITEKSIKPVFAGESAFLKISFILIYTLHHLVYFALLIFMFYQFIYYKKQNPQVMFSCMHIYIFCVIATGVILLAFGVPRYKHPIFVLLLITITPMIAELKWPNIKKRVV